MCVVHASGAGEEKGKAIKYLMTLTKTASVIGVKGNGGSVKASGRYVRKTIRRFEPFVPFRGQN